MRGNRPWILHDHLLKISSCIPHNGLLLEYGAGGSTRWFSADSHRGYRVVSVEHNKTWFDKCKGLPRVDLRLFTPKQIVIHHGKTPVSLSEPMYDVITQETTLCCSEYVFQPELADADVIFIDGVFRNTCAVVAALLAKKHAVICLHDSQDPLYEIAATALSERCEKIFHGDSYTDNPRPDVDKRSCLTMWRKP